MLRGTNGEGNGIPLAYSCLENPRDRGAWWAAIYGVPQSRTRLKRLSSSSSSSKLITLKSYTIFPLLSGRHLLHEFCSLIEGNGTPLQYFCLENPMGGGAWWAAVHGVARVGHD